MSLSGMYDFHWFIEWELPLKFGPTDIIFISMVVQCISIFGSLCTTALFSRFVQLPIKRSHLSNHRI